MKPNRLLPGVFVLVSALLPSLLSAFQASGQKTSLSTNVAQYANLLTLNLEASYAFDRHWSARAGFRYNPFEYKRNSDPGDNFQNKQLAYALGVRYWPWHVFSGWWLSGNAQYQEYNSGGILSRKTSEGDRIGMSLGWGYTYMLNPRLNLEFGLAVWGGYDAYTIYECPVCGLTVEDGKKFFFLPEEIILALTYVF